MEAWLHSFLPSAVDRVSGQLHALTTFSRERGRVGPGASLDTLEKREISCSCQESNPSSLVVHPIAQSLHWLQCCCNGFLLLQLMDGRKSVGGKLEVKVRIRNPILTKQVEQVQEKWLVIDHLQWSKMQCTVYTNVQWYLFTVHKIVFWVTSRQVNDLVQFPSFIVHINHTVIISCHLSASDFGS